MRARLVAWANRRSEALASIGPGCKTPCSVSVPAPDAPFTVSYTLNKYQPASVPVNVIKNPGDFLTPETVTSDPNPVFAELQPATPPNGQEALPAEKAEAGGGSCSGRGSRCWLAVPRSPNSAPPPAAPAPKH